MTATNKPVEITDDELIVKAIEVSEDLGREPWLTQVVTCNARDSIDDLIAEVWRLRTELTDTKAAALELLDAFDESTGDYAKELAAPDLERLRGRLL